MFTEYEYLSAVREFLLAYPYSAPYDAILIDHEQIVQSRGSDKQGAGAALMLTGDTIISTRRNVIGREIHNKRVNFALVLWRATNDDELRRDIANALTRLIGWVNAENAKRKTKEANPALPKFSMTDTETISATGGIKTMILDGGRSEYQVQIHCDYQIVY